MRAASAEPTYTEIQTRCNMPRQGWLVSRAERRFLKCPCGRWRCVGCARYKARLIARRFKLMMAGCAARLVTVTLAQELSESTAKRQMKHLRRWMARRGLIERAGWVAEFGSKGHRLHFHMIIATKVGFWPYAELQAAARRCGLGNLDCSEEVNHEAGARYVAKYVTKQAEAHSARTIGHRRRFHCPQKAPKKTGEWEFSPLSPRAAPVVLVAVIPTHSSLYLRAAERHDQLRC